MHAVGRRRRHPRGHRARLGDALLEQLTVLRFAVGEQGAGVLGLIELPHGGVDTDLAEQARHAEGACLIGDDGYDARSQRLVAQQPAEEAHEGHRGRHLFAVRFERELRIALERRHGERRRLATTARHRPAERIAARSEIAHLRAVCGRPMEAQLRDVVVGERQVEAVTELEQRLDVEFLLLMRRHARLARTTHAVALFGLGEDHGGLPAMGTRRGEGRIELAEIVPATLECVDLGGRHVCDQGPEFRIEPEEFLLVVGAVVRAQGLVLTIDRVGKCTQ